MPKNILLFSDGTGNSAAKLAKTNVWRLYLAADLSDPEKQIAYYDDGVGTSSFKPLAIAGGAFGWGLKRNVLDLYSFLCTNYREGDRIFCFGFSRGAFTVRVLAGLIVNEGIVIPNEDGIRGRVKTAYRAYRRKRFHSALRLETIGRALRDVFMGDKQYREAWERAPKPPIAFLGVWDTVAAYGLPIDELTRALGFVMPLTPADREPLPNVERIRHAVALDDERNTFYPLLFNEANLPGRNETSEHIDQERVTQVWFAGMHSNVGGGYPDDALSGVSLCWMMEQAKQYGLLLKEDAEKDARLSANALGKMYDSRKGLSGFYRYFPRRMAILTNNTFDRKRPCVIPRPKIHESVMRRIEKSIDGYAPIGFPLRYAVVSADGKILDRPAAPDAPPGKMTAQEAVWNLVWWKRVVYFLSVAVAGLLLLFPWWRPATESCENWACFVAPAIDTVALVTPQIAAPLFDAYRSHPATFLALAGVFALLLRVGQSLRDRIFGRMRKIWVSGNAAPEPRRFPYGLRTSRPYRFFFRWMKKLVLPAVFGLLALAVLSGTASRIGFKAMSSAGFVCRPEAGSLTFDTASMCAYTGASVEEGKRYRIVLQSSGPWMDRQIVTGVGGFNSEKVGWLRGFAVWFRRDFRERWFTPIARIGQYGNDEYALHPVDGSIPGEDARKLVAEFTARRGGPLFLFVNDGVFPVFYRNNRGQGQVTIERVEEKAP
jgi:uncharacterized protein (DUF2235 family)